VSESPERADTVNPDREVTAGEAMSSPVVTVPEGGTILEAWTVMVTFRVRHAVVVRGDHCIGVLDDRALVEAWESGPSVLRSTAVRQLIGQRTVCVLPDASLREVAAIMNTCQVDAVPVVRADGKLVGLITAGDVIHAVSEHGLHAARDDGTRRDKKDTP